MFFFSKKEKKKGENFGEICCHRANSTNFAKFFKVTIWGGGNPKKKKKPMLPIEVK